MTAGMAGDLPVFTVFRQSGLNRTTQRQTTYYMAPSKILIADDDALVREAVVKILEMFGH